MALTPVRSLSSPLLRAARLPGRRTALLAFALVAGAGVARAGDCTPIDYLRAPVNGTYDLKTDKTYRQSALIYKGGTAPWTAKVIAGSLPPGITLEVVPFTGGWALDGYSGDVDFVGQPTAEGDFSAQVQLTDSCVAGAQSKTSWIVVKPRCGQFKFADGTKLPPATLGKPYSYPFKTTCDPKYKPQGFNVNQSTLPAGLTLSDTGLLSGTPTALGTSNISVSTIAYGSAAQTVGPQVFPLQVVDDVPPTLTYFDLTSKTIGFLGGKTTMVVRASDNGLLRFPQITVTNPDGSQTRYYAGVTSGTYSNGEFQATITLPANGTAADVVYKVGGVLLDTAGNTVTCPSRTITVTAAPAHIPPQPPASQRPRLPPPPRLPGA